MNLTLFTIILLFLAGRSLVLADESERPKTTPVVVRILNWIEYADLRPPKSEGGSSRTAAIWDEFMKKHSCRVVYDTYSDTSDMLKKIDNAPGYYDILVTSHGDVDQLVEKGKLAKISEQAAPNVKHVLPHYRKLTFAPDGDHFIPYLVGTTGLVYNSSLTGGAVESWKTYFEPPAKLKGKLAMLKDPRVMFPLAMMAYGADPNATNAEIINKAGERLFRLKTQGFIGLLTNDVHEIRAKFLDGSIAMSVLHSNDALPLLANPKAKNLKYIIPKEGGEFYIDCLAILKDSKHKKLAAEFINLLISPKVQAANPTYRRHACPNGEALDIIRKTTPERLDNPIVYPPKKVLNRLKFFDNPSPEIEAVWEKIFHKK